MTTIAVGSRPVSATDEAEPERAWRLALRRLGFTIAALALVTILTNVCMPLFLGGDQLYTTTTGSMTPTFQIGSLEVLKHEATAQVKPGDIIGLMLPVAGGNTDFVVHRVVSVTESDSGNDGVRYSVVTRGDANNFRDPTRTVGAEVEVETRVVQPLFGVLPLGSYLNWVRAHVLVLVGVAVVGLLPAIVLPARKVSKRRH